YLTSPDILTISFCFSTHTATTQIYTLSLHDALPIFSPEPYHVACDHSYEHDQENTCSNNPNQDHYLHQRANANAKAVDSDRVIRSEEHTSELQSRENLVCRLLLEKKNKKIKILQVII